MNNKDLFMIGSVGIVAITTVVTYLVKKKQKRSVRGRLMEDMEILGASLEDKNWWLTKECQVRSKEIINWVESQAKDEDEEIKNALKVIKEKHWMTKNYQTAFRILYDWAKIKIQ